MKGGEVNEERGAFCVFVWVELDREYILQVSNSFSCCWRDLLYNWSLSVCE